MEVQIPEISDFLDSQRSPCFVKLYLVPILILVIDEKVFFDSFETFQFPERVLLINRLHLCPEIIIDKRRLFFFEILLAILHLNLVHVGHIVWIWFFIRLTWETVPVPPLADRIPKRVNRLSLIL